MMKGLTGFRSYECPVSGLDPDSGGRRICGFDPDRSDAARWLRCRDAMHRVSADRVNKNNQLKIINHQILTTGLKDHQSLMNHDMVCARAIYLSLTAVVKAIKAIKVRIKNMNTINGLAAGYPYPCSPPVRAGIF
jgi:hypothetical protein